MKVITQFYYKLNKLFALKNNKFQIKQKVFLNIYNTNLLKKFQTQAVKKYFKK